MGSIPPMVSPDQAWAGEIRAYQTERVGKLGGAGGEPAGFSVEPRRKKRRRRGC
jgi:hypothetical protein